MDSSSKKLVHKFNTIGYKKPITHIKDLVISSKYAIMGAKRMTTKYGETIKLELQDNIMFLPRIYNSLTDEDVKNLSTGLYLVYREDENKLRLKVFEDTDLFTQNSQYPVFTLENF